MLSCSNGCDKIGILIVLMIVGRNDGRHGQRVSLFRFWSLNSEIKSDTQIMGVHMYRDSIKKVLPRRLTFNLY